MFDRSELYKDVFMNGTIEMKCFSEKFLRGKHKEYWDLIESTTKKLYESGLTPAEVKGFYEVAEVLSIYIHP